MNPTADRPWWADVQHLRPEADGGAARAVEHRDLTTRERAGADAPASAPTTVRAHERSGAVSSRRFERTTASAEAPANTEARAEAPARRGTSAGTAVADRPRRATPDFDFDVGLASLLDPPAEPVGEWTELTIDEALSELAGPRVDDRAARLDEDDRASGWELDEWSEPARRAGRRTVQIRGQVAEAFTDVLTTRPARRPPRTAAERLQGRPDRIAMWAFVLGLILIVLAAFGTPKANAAQIDAAAATTAPPAVVVAAAP